MSSSQKVIKYCSMGFAIMLIISIVSAITMGIVGIQSGMGFDGVRNYEDFTKEYTQVDNLKIRNYDGRFNLRKSDSDKVIVKASHVPDTVTVELTGDNTLEVDARDSIGWFVHLFDGNFMSDNDSEITIFVPEGFTVNEADIKNGSGDMEIDGISAKDFELNAGSGSVKFYNFAAEHFDIHSGSGRLDLSQISLQDGVIDGGSGEVYITNSVLKDIKLSAGSGHVSIEGNMTGSNEIHGGSGSVRCELSNTYSSYNLDLDYGSGSININDKKCRDHEINNVDAQNDLSIDGGSGKISINFLK